jgi:hypothetical protein
VARQPAAAGLDAFEPSARRGQVLDLVREQVHAHNDAFYVVDLAEVRFHRRLRGYCEAVAAPACSTPAAVCCLCGVMDWWIFRLALAIIPAKRTLAVDLVLPSPRSYKHATPLPSNHGSCAAGGP